MRSGLAGAGIRSALIGFGYAELGITYDNPKDAALIALSVIAVQLVVILNESAEPTRVEIITGEIRNEG